MAEIESLNVFIRQFTPAKLFHKDDLMRLGREIYLVPSALRLVSQKARRRPDFAGTLIAMESSRGPKPSIQLLDMIAGTDAKRVVVNAGSEWLCICGRPPLLTSVVEKTGNPQRGDTVLITNAHREVIGYGTVHDEWSRKKGIISLHYDIGDFLRRERASHSSNRRQPSLRRA